MYLQIKDLSFSYGGAAVLNRISFSAAKGQVLGLLGPNGAGKTTLLKCVGCMLPVRQGDILLDDKSLLSLPPKKRARKIGYVPQSSGRSMACRVLDIIMMGRIPYLRFRPSNQDRQIAFEAIERLQLETLAFRQFDGLSGGERQRVLMARAIAQQPELLLLDEPTSNLDMKYQLETIRLVRNYAAEKQVTTVVSIHDLNLASILCDQVVLFKDGSPFAQGNSQQVFTPENIRQVYEVDVDIAEWQGRKQVFFSRL